MTAPKPTPKPREKPVAELRGPILILLAEGYTVSHIARELACARSTVRSVRALPESQAKLAAARKERAAQGEASVEDARRILREASQAAALVLADGTQHADPRVRVRAAREVLDRIGIPRIEEVQTRNLDAPDLSKLTDEELATWERLNAKVSPA